MTTSQSDTSGNTPGPQVVLHEERLQIGAERVPVERLLLRKVVVTEIRQVEVAVRREELHIERAPVDDGRAVDGAALDGPGAGPLVIVLAREVPVVQLRTEAYETVSVYIDTVTDTTEVTQPLSRERADVSTDASPAVP